jgi:hypothetical protein
MPLLIAETAGLSRRDEEKRCSHTGFLKYQLTVKLARAR